MSTNPTPAQMRQPMPLPAQRGRRKAPRTREVYLAPSVSSGRMFVAVTEWHGKVRFNTDREYYPTPASLRRLAALLKNCPPVDGVQQPVIGIHPYGPTLSYLLRGRVGR